MYCVIRDTTSGASETAGEQREKHSSDNSDHCQHCPPSADRAQPAAFGLHLEQEALPTPGHTVKLNVYSAFLTESGVFLIC